jgi:cell division protein FtsB
MLVERLATMARSGGRGLLSICLGAIMVALIGLLIANFVGQVMQSARLEASRAALQVEVDQLRAEQRTLEGAVDYAESDVNVERIAREQLGYARDGDTVILPQIAAPTPAPPISPAAAPAPTPAPAASNVRRWWDAFFSAP